jgi:hypothetical protein
VRNDPKTGAAPKVDTGTWTSGGGNMNTPYTVNPDFDWGAAYNKATGGDGGGGGGGESIEERLAREAREERERLERLRTMNANAIMNGQMAAFGLRSLAGKITTWIQEGFEPDAIMALVRQSDEYAQRFPAMKALQQKGRTISEAEYIGYEQSMAQYERLFGLPQGMLSDKDMITKLLTNEVSVREVEERATRASAAAYELPKEYRDMMRNYYGVDTGGLTGYMLDPDVASPLLERQFVSAQIGMEAAMRSINVGKETAEGLFERGIGREEAAAGFNEVALNSGLSAGRGDVATQEQRIGSAFKTDAGAQEATERAALSRLGRFEGGGSFAESKQGIGGLGGASR